MRLMECDCVKVCSKCGVEKSSTNFNKDRGNDDELDFYCRSCRKIMYTKQRAGRLVRAKIYREENKERLLEGHRRWSYGPSGVYSSLIKNNKKRDVVVEMKRDEFVIWWESQIQECHYCGIPLGTMLKLNWSRGKKRMSIDRKDNNKSYQLNNIVLSCMKCNCVKSDVITYKEMKDIVGPLIRKKWESVYNS